VESLFAKKGKKHPAGGYGGRGKEGLEPGGGYFGGIITRKRSQPENGLSLLFDKKKRFINEQEAFRLKKKKKRTHRRGRNGTMTHTIGIHQ